MKKQLFLIALLASTAFSAQASDTIQRALASATTGALAGATIGATAYLLSIRPGYYAFNCKECKSATLSGATIGAITLGAFGAMHLSGKTEFQISVLTTLAIWGNSIRTNQPKELIKRPEPIIEKGLILNSDFPASTFLIARAI